MKDENVNKQTQTRHKGFRREGDGSSTKEVASEIKERVGDGYAILAGRERHTFHGDDEI